MLMNKEVSCGNFKGLIAYLRKHYGDEGVRKIFEGLVNNDRYLVSDKDDLSRTIPIQEDHLIDAAYWVSYDFTLLLFGNVRKLMDGPDPLFVAGEGAVTEYFSKSMYFVVRIFGIKFLSKQVSKLNARANRVKEVTLAELTDNSAKFEIHNFPDFPASKDICDWNRGIYTGLAKLTDAMDVKCEEIKCKADGAEHCVFLLTWRKREGFIRRIFRLILRSITKDLVSDYEIAVKERDQLIDSLTRSEEKYRLLVDNANDAIYIAQDEVIKFANPKTEEMVGYTADELAKISFVNLIHPEDQGMVLDRHKKRLAGEELPSTYSFRIINRTGEELKVQLNTVVITWEGRPATLNFLRNITQQKELEAQLQRAKKMEAIGTLAGGVAHDLNNILGGLVSYPELLLMQMPEDSPLRDSILTIQKSGEKAAAVVQDLLTLARRGVVITNVVNLNDVIAEYLKSPEHENLQSYHPGVHLETHLAIDTLNILGSSTHLSKTVMNLVSNAAEAMPVGGKITVTTENRYIDRPIRGYDNVKEGDYVVLTVSDTGTGISPDDIEKIFEPFYTKKKMGRSGTGLGMAVVWGTVKDHNGYIDVQSTEGKARPPRLSARDGGQGTTFTLYFPVTREKLPEDESSLPIESYRGNGESILIVDDVEEQRNIASGMLRELGYSVVSVSSGEEAVEYLKTNNADLLLLDMIMDPGMDGLDTYKKIIELHPGQRAIIASGFSETDRVKEVQRLGAGAYTKKPFLLEKIGLAVKEELER